MLKVISFARSAIRGNNTLKNNNCNHCISSTRSLSQKLSSSETQDQCDVLIVGGGGVGSSTAYWLKKKVRDGLKVVVVERDLKYTEASTVLSVGGVRQQFSNPENIQMSLFGAEFMNSVTEHLGDVDLCLNQNGYLVLASEKGAELLKSNSKLQNELGARNILLTPDKLKSKFPFLNTEGVALGCLGVEKEGWFDPWALLNGFKKTAKEYGAAYVNGEVLNFEFKEESKEKKIPEKALVKLPNGEIQPIKFKHCVIASGFNSGHVGKLAGIGTGEGILSIPIPVEPRKRYVYVYDCQGTNVPAIGTPLTIDTDGTYFRRDGLGRNYLCGRSPDAEFEPPADNLEVDHSFFENTVWPRLAHRVPAFESVKVTSSWAGYYDYNTFDENGIIGQHPILKNIFIATGFSGHGIQQTPAAGRAISELIIDGRYTTIDLKRMGFERIINKQRVGEVHIV